MSIVLATAAAMGGMMFDCTASTAYLTVFAPDEEVTSRFRGNVLTLYEVKGDGEIITPGMRKRQVLDFLPDSLMVQMASSEFELEINIADYDADAGTSVLILKGGPVGEEPQTIPGTCKVTRTQREGE